MADYYPLIVRLVSELDPSAPAEARGALYQHARTALIKQLRSVQPPLTETQMTTERLSLEQAIRAVDMEVSRTAEIGGRKHPSLLTRADLERARQRNEQAARTKAEEARLRQEEEFRLRTEAEMRRLAEEQARRDAEQLARQREDEEARALSKQRASVPNINAIPEQNLTRAIGFSATRSGPLDLVNDPPTDPHDIEQSLLYGRIRQQLEKMKEDVPHQERTQVNFAIDDFLSQPTQWHEVTHKKILWLSGNSLRALLARHDAVRSDPEHYSKLPPSVAEAMRSPVQAWSIFVQGDPALAELDRYSLGPREQQGVMDNLAAAQSVVSKVSDNRTILTERAANTLNSTMKSASSTSSDINTKLAQEFADKTSRNLLSVILRKAYLVREAIIDPSTPEAKELGENFFKGVTTAAGFAAFNATVFAGSHAFPYLEFVASNPGLIKEYILVAFQNSQMVEIVDAIEFEYRRLKKRP